MEYRIVMILENLANIKRALSRTPPDWEMALGLWMDRLDYSPIGLCQRTEPFHADPVIDSREAEFQIADEVWIEAEHLQEALEARDRHKVNELVASIEQKLHALVAKAPVA